MAADACPEPPPKSYFDFIDCWLKVQPKQTARAVAVGCARPKRRVTDELANFTRNRIRAGRPDWQKASWFARHKLTDTVVHVTPRFDDHGIQGLAGKDRRLILAHTHGDRLRLRATMAFLNNRVDEHYLSDRCYGGRPQGTLKGTDRGAALRRFRRLVWGEGRRWVAKLDVKKFYDRLPHGRVLDALEAAVPDRGCHREIEGYLAWYWRESWPGHTTLPANPVGLPQGSPVSGVLANIFMTSFDNALTAAGVEHIRYLDDVSLVARSPEELAAHLNLAMSLLVDLGLELAAEKTRVACLGTRPPRPGSLVVSGSPRPLRIDSEFDLLGVHFYGDGQWRARNRTVKRLLSKARRIIIRDRHVRSPIVRYIVATAVINRMLGYHVGKRRPGSRPQPTSSAAVTGEFPRPPGPALPRSMMRSPSPGHRQKARSRQGRLRQNSGAQVTMTIRRATYVTGRVWISGMRFVQPRQHALLGYSALVAAQMHHVDRLIRRWMKSEFDQAIANTNPPPVLLAPLRGRRIRSALKMYEMAVRDLKLSGASHP
jgi:hypothetical protein